MGDEEVAAEGAVDPNGIEDALEDIATQMASKVVAMTIEAIILGLQRNKSQVEAGEFGKAFEGIVLTIEALDSLGRGFSPFVPEEEAKGILIRGLERKGVPTETATEMAERIGNGAPAGVVSGTPEEVAQQIAASGAIDGVKIGSANDTDPALIDAVKQALEDTFGVEADIVSVGPNGEIEGRLL